MKKYLILFILIVLFVFFTNNCKTEENPVPILSSISPSSKVTHMPVFTLTATGTDFVEGAKIFFNNLGKNTSFVSSSELTCVIEPDDITSNTTLGVNVWVENPEPGGGISQSLQFTINPNHLFYDPVNVSSTSGESSKPSIAVDENSTLHVAWLDDTTGSNEIYYSRSENQGASWSPLVNISSLAISTWDPFIAAGSGNNIYIVWIDILGTVKVVVSRSNNGGTSWNTPQEITGATGSCYKPYMVVAGDDDLYVVWDELVSKDIIFSRSSDGGASWTTPMNISNTSGWSKTPAMAVDSSSNIYVVWEDSTAGKEKTYFSKSIDNGASWAQAKMLLSTSGSNTLHDMGSFDPSNLYIVWQDDTLSSNEIFFARSQNGGDTWSAGINISNNVGSSREPRIAVDSAGNLNVIWWDVSTSDHDIYFIRSIDEGSFWFNQTNISDTPGAVFDPFITVDQEGNIFAVWMDESYGNGEIFFTSNIF